MTALTKQRVDLLYVLVGRDVRLRYRRSVLGAVWSQLGPLTLLAVLTFVFTRVVPLGIDHYPAFALVGLLAWAWFQAGVVAATESVVGNADLVRRPGFPVALLPVTAAGSQLVNHMLALPIAVLAVAWSTGRVPLTIVALPAVLASQLLLMLGPCLMLAALNVRFRDVRHAVTVVLVPLFYATPVFYDVAHVPDRFRWLYDLNPLAHLVVAYRDTMLDGAWPAPWPLLGVAVAGAVGAVAGHHVFDRAAARFAEEL